jgi:hypothetical protein
MDDFETATQRLAEATRTLRLLNFRLVQLRYTNDQLLAALQDLLAQVSPAPAGDTPTVQPTQDPLA